MKKTIVIIGVGPGLGLAIAKRFAGAGFRVILSARNENSLKQLGAELEAAGTEVICKVADAEDRNGFAAAIEEIKKLYGTPDVVVYNVVMRSPDTVRMTAQDLVRHFNADVAGAYAAVEGFADSAFADKNGVIIFTGGGFALYPAEKSCALSVDKAALRSLAHILHEKYKPQGIFIGTVTICGTVNGDKYFAADNIAESYWQMFSRRDRCEYVYQYPSLVPEKLYAGRIAEYDLFEQNADNYWNMVRKIANELS